MSGKEIVKEDLENTWAKIAHDIHVASVNIKNGCSDCETEQVKVPNAVICSTCGNLIKEVKSK